MKASTRLILVALIIVGSSLYGLLVVRDPGLASAVASGYVALFGTAFFLINVWKRQ